MTQQQGRTVEQDGFSVLPRSEILRINCLVKSHGICCSGGSHITYTDGSKETTVCFSSERGSQVAYNKRKVAALLRETMGYEELVLDGSKME